MDKSIKGIKLHILDINSDGLNKPWCEGYLSALVDMDVINENDFDDLIDWLNNIYN